MRARAGLGRLALDLTARPGLIGCLVRPPLEAASIELSAVYEGLLEAVVSAALGDPYVARCIEGSDLEALPWRFGLVARGEAAALEARPGERPDDVAHRLGFGAVEAPAHNAP